MGWQLGYVEPVLFIYMLGIFYSMPAEQQLIYHKVCLSHYNNTFCDSINSSKKGHSKEENVVQKMTAQWDMYLSLAKTIPAIGSTILLGAYSDGIGRKNIMMFTMIGETLNIFCYFLNAWFVSAPITYLLIGCFISGFCGNFASILMAIFSYIADITTQETRTFRILLLDATIFVASLISYPTGGLIIEHFGFVTIYGLALALDCLIIMYILFLKESYFPVHQYKMKDLVCIGKLKETLHFFTQNRGKYYRIKIFLLSFTFFLLFFQIIGSSSVLILYVYHSPLNFIPSNVGYLLAEGNALKGIGACFVAAILMKKFKWHDYSVLVLTCALMFGQILCIGLSRTQWQVYLSYVWGIGCGAGVSACRSRFSKMASQEEQGKINSVIGILQVLSKLVGGLASNAIYKMTVDISPSITFYILAGISLFPLFSSIMLIIYEKKTVSYELQINDTESNDTEYIDTLNS